MTQANLDQEKDKEKESDWQSWLERWHQQQAAYLPQRAERFEIMLDYVAGQRGNGALHLIDLCCGPGSITQVALERFPQATVTAIDYDPWLIEIGRHTIGINKDRERVRWVEADLRQTDWLSHLETGQVDAVLSATALHWFEADELVRLYRQLATVLAEGGLFLNADHQPIKASGLNALGRQRRTDFQTANFSQGHEGKAETWEQYWKVAHAEEAFKPLLTERDRRFPNQHHGVELGVAFHQEALLAAGFKETGEVWRQDSDAILAAIR